MTNRRDFIKSVSLGTLALPVLPFEAPKKSTPKIGLVTYQWGKDWDVATIIRNCEKSKVLGVELRTEHKHGVEPSMNSQQRKKARAQFSDSQVTLLGYGSNTQFDDPDPAVVRKNMEMAKSLLQLSHDVGGTGVKVKPNRFHEGVTQRKTLEQIGRSLNELGKFAAALGQQVRLEVHGPGTQLLPNIKTIMDVADDPHVAVCWNCNAEDADGQGLEYNFNLVKSRLGDTIHIHELNNAAYPCVEFAKLLKKANYSGWLLLECVSNPPDIVEAMTEQRIKWENLIAKS